MVRITPRVSCGEAWRDPGAARVSAGAAANDSQGRDRSCRLLQPVVIRHWLTFLLVPRHTDNAKLLPHAQHI
jgi:hypothetical protein